MSDRVEEAYAWMNRDSRGWDRAWGEIARRYGDTVCRCPETGEAWQYIGTMMRAGVPTQHCFRHRSFNGERRDAGVAAESDDLLSVPAVTSKEFTAERLDALDQRAREAAERASKATAGEWAVNASYRRPELTVFACDLPEQPTICVLGIKSPNDENADFIAHAREDVPALSAAVLALSAEVRRLREREARLVHERECLGTAIADAALKAGISNGLPMTGPELILMTREMASEILRCRGLIEHSEMLLRHGTRGEMAVADVVDRLLEEEA